MTGKDVKGKYRPSLVPMNIIKCIARVREFGIQKYNGADNWKKVESQHYRDAMMRHMIEYLINPQSKDKESGLPHLWHIACNCAFLCDREHWEE